MSVASGDAPVKNWGGIGAKDFPITKSNKISGNAVTQYQREQYSCSSCPLGCGGLLDVREGEFSANKVHRPEYETLASFGPLLLNHDIESIIKSADICNRYGMDTISAGTAIAFALECYDNGLISKEETGGLELKWGDSASIISALKQIGERKNLGEILADGVKKASEEIGNGSEKYSIHINGQEPGMHDPKGAPSFGTTYVVDPAPGRHTPGGAAFAEMMGTKFPLEDVEIPSVKKYQYTGKGVIQKDSSHLSHAVNSLGLCMFPTMGIVEEIPTLKILNAATGWNLDTRGLLMIGERILTARHVFNLTEGINPKNFTLPDRMKGVPPQESGANRGITVDIESLVKDYYKAMEWDSETTWPSSERLETLGLKEIVDKRIKG
jgi:aldehyde:ferredoxin oxidoreductase